MPNHDSDPRPEPSPGATSIDLKLASGRIHAEDRVPAGETLVINDMPTGTFTTELVGWEAPRNWSIAPPTYEQTITIEPAPAARVAPSRVVYEGPPAYVSDGWSW